MASATYVPPLWSIAPFVLLVAAIAVMPLVATLDRFWRHNRYKLLVAVGLSIPVVLFYYCVHPAMAPGGEGPPAAELAQRVGVLGYVLDRAILEQYLPFILLLASLYTISGGIQVRGHPAARPLVNTAYLAVGAVLASLIGTTGAAMLLIRPLLESNAGRKHVRHTVVFFIFMVCNVGGCLLPTGDPPLLLGYLMGVPFLWTLGLAAPWAVTCAVLLVVYYLWDCATYRKETPAEHRMEDAVAVPLGVRGKINFAYLAGVVLAVALLVPGQPMPLCPAVIVPPHMREAVMVAIAGLSLATTPRGLRAENRFNFAAIGEVAALFLGIFITMQAPIELLQVRGPALGLTQPWQFFWATGGLSSFLDNAPTYAVFFETAGSLTSGAGSGIMQLAGGHFIRTDLLAAVSLGAVFMGAMTYIGNGPNFMVRAIAEHHGVRMPSFLGYMAYSVAILIPIFILLTVAFFICGLM
jgi:Na+/H+ antiporter NhaD/arsenite permease-like protein